MKGKKRCKCQTCGTDFDFPDVPSFCPFCGSSSVMDRSKIHALELIKEMNDMLPEIEQKQREYTLLLARFAQLKKIVKSYADREVISFDDIPKIRKVTIKKLEKGR